MRGVPHDPVLRAKLMALHEHGTALAELSRAYGIARPVLSRWWMRYQAADLAGLQPLSRRPHRSPQQRSTRDATAVLQLRARGLSAARITWATGLGHGTVQRILERARQSRLPRPPKAKPKRYEKQRPGELVHIDIKFLPALRNARYDYEFAAVDDFSREAVVWIGLDQTSASATVFLEQVLASLPYRVEAILTDNAFAFTMRYAHHSSRQTRFEQACAALGIRHYLLRPRAPQSNGKVERFFRTVDDECLNRRALFTFRARSKAVDEFVWFYNHQRPHFSLGGMTPVDRRKLFFRQLQA
jgi:transposase InsO family protein